MISRGCESNLQLPKQERHRLSKLTGNLDNRWQRRVCFWKGENTSVKCSTWNANRLERSTS